MMNADTRYKRFQTTLRVRPDDIDMFNHVHNSRYFDYVLAARYEQMETAYQMSMEEFMNQGYGWVVRTAHVDYKRPLTMGEEFTVETGLEDFHDRGCRVSFQIQSNKTGKLCCDGWFDYILIDIKTGRSARITEEMRAKYTV